MAEHSHEPLAETLRRLKEERDRADALYNDALTALDRALTPTIDLPALPSPIDEHQVTPLNESWNTLPAPPDMGPGWRGRLTRLVWRVVAPYFERQLTFNSRLVDHVNRNVAASREAHRALDAAVAALGAHLRAVASFHALQMLFLQHVTGYIDTKDRESAGGQLVLNASLSGLAESDSKRWESLASRDARQGSRLAAIDGRLDDLRTMNAVAQQAVATLKREVERMGDAAAPPAGRASAPPVQAGRDAFAAALDAYKYVGFEDRFRGSREVIRARLESYLPLFDPAAGSPGPGGDVLDVGCGRGEFLDLLAARGIPARGIDLNHEMAEGCRARGLKVEEADAVGYLASLPDASLGGVFAAQVVEHLQPGYLLRFLELAYLKLQPGGRIVLETINPACWVAFFESYIRDITHVWPLHPDTLKYLVAASGFSRADVEFRSPVPPEDRLQTLATPAGADAATADVLEAFNANVEKLNARMFTSMDYAVIGER